MAPSRKICTLEQLLSLREQARRSGRTVVHCHGCFDIVHPGHIHHLQFARSVGDLLVVRDTGAYGSVMASNYNRRPMPAEVLVQDGRATVIRRRQTIDDLVALES